MSPPVRWATIFLCVFAFLIARMFWRACIRGLPIPSGEGRAPFTPVELDDIPSTAADTLDAIESDITDTGAAHLGYASKPTFGGAAWFTVWITERCDAIVLGTVGTSSTDQRVYLAFVDVCSELADGTNVATNNWDNFSAKDSDRYRIRAYPGWVTAPDLVRIHRARLAQMSSPVRPFEPDLASVIDRDRVSNERSEVEWREALRPARNGRYRLTIGEFARALSYQLPFVGLINRARRNARRMKDLRALGIEAPTRRSA